MTIIGHSYVGHNRIGYDRGGYPACESMHRHVCRQGAYTMDMCACMRVDMYAVTRCMDMHTAVSIGMCIDAYNGHMPWTRALSYGL